MVWRRDLIERVMSLIAGWTTRASALIGASIVVTIVFTIVVTRHQSLSAAITGDVPRRRFFIDPDFLNASLFE
jgi:hypothetical protein